MKVRSDNRVQVCFSDEELRAIEAVNAKYGSTKSGLIKIAVRNYLQQLNKGVV